MKGGETFAKAYGIKVRCYGEHVQEHIGNLGNILGTERNIDENTLGPGKNAKKNPSLPRQKLKREKKASRLERMLGSKIMLPIGCTKFLFPKRVHHHFWPGLHPAVQRTPYQLLQKTQSTFPSLAIFKTQSTLSLGVQSERGQISYP